MSRSLMEIESEIIQLPLADRAVLAEKLLESLDDVSREENARLWAQEAVRRLKAMREGKVIPVDEEEAFSKAYAALNEADQI